MVIILVMPASLKRAANSYQFSASVQGQFGDLRKRRLSKLDQIERYLLLRFSVLVHARENPLGRMPFSAKAYFKKHPKNASQNRQFLVSFTE
jgi:hypothetical protein